jgi:hypothetical protein
MQVGGGKRDELRGRGTSMLQDTVLYYYQRRQLFKHLFDDFSKLDKRNGPRPWN